MSALTDACVHTFVRESRPISQSGAGEMLLFSQFSNPNTGEKQFFSFSEMNLISGSESHVLLGKQK